MELLCRLPALQISLLLGLLPLTAILFGRVAWLAPLVNLLVLPVFNLVTVPAALLGVSFDGGLQAAGDLLLRLSWHSIRLILTVVGVMAEWPAAQADVAVASRLVVAAALLSALWALLPPGWPGRRLSLVAAITVLLGRMTGPPPGCVDVAVLDVGQGLAMVLRTRSRTLVFDTGPAFRGGGDTAGLVVLPYLRREGIDRVELLLLSHADADHAGGAGTLLEGLRVGRVLVGQTVPELTVRQLQCRRGQTWEWDGVRFAVVHPGTEPSRSENDRSCVLEVATGERRTLLTGDIEAAAERRLLTSASLSAADVVIVPHHGSRTSSGPAFVRRLRPQLAIVSAGFGNRWDLPDAGVVRRWQEQGARVLNTATSGAIRYRMCTINGVQMLREHRKSRTKHWQAR